MAKPSAPTFDQMQASATQASELIKVLANRNRLLILCQLVESEQPVSVLVQQVGLSQSAVSQHLAKMRDEAIVATRRQGQEIYYRVDNPVVAELLEVLYRYYCGPQ